VPGVLRLLTFHAGRPGADSDMAATILFLAGPGGLFYNEQTLFPDGGKASVTFWTECFDTDVHCRFYTRPASR